MLILLLTACLSDIRPAGVEDATDVTSEAQARELLTAMADAHGHDAWASKARAEMTLTDTWRGIAKFLRPWPDTVMRGHVVQVPGTFDSSVEFLDGSRTGETWGIRQGETYRIDTAGQTHVEDNPDAAFMLPTVQYILDMPFRIGEAPIVRSADPQTIGGVTYDVVFATWDSVQGNHDYDQYVLYIEPDTHQLAKVQFTVRDVGRMVTSACHFDDRELTDGVLVPRTISVTSSPSDDAEEDWMHQMVVEDLRYVVRDEG